MIRKIGAIIKKNIKLVTRTKSSALIIILGPLLLILLIGAAFNTANIYGIRVGTYSESYSTLTNAVIDELHKKRFSTVEIESKDVCIDSIRNGIVHVCAIFPPDLSIKKGGDITFYVDNSRMNLVYIVLDTLSSIVGSKSKELSTQLTKNIIDVLDSSERELRDKQPVLDEVKVSTEGNKARLIKVTQDLSKLDLIPPKFSIVALETAIGTALSEPNAQVTELLIKIKQETRDVEGRFESIAVTRQSTIDEVEKTRQVLASNIDYLVVLSAATSNIAHNIKNVKTTSISKIVSPLTTKIEPITKDQTHLNYVFPTLIILIIMFVTMLLAATLEIKEKNAKVYFKNFITPTSDILFIISNFLTNLFIVGLQLVVLFGVALFFFKDQILISLQNILLALFLVATLFTLIGMVIGNIFRSEETGTLAAISLGFIFLFFSSAILPIETLPGLIGKIATFNPFFIGEGILNKALLFQSPLQPLLPSMYLLGSYIVGLLMVVIVTKKIAKRRI